MSDDNERVFDYLDDLVGTEVRVYRKDESCVTGKLMAFDKHLNLAMSNVTITASIGADTVVETNENHIQRGDYVVDIQPASKGGGG